MVKPTEGGWPLQPFFREITKRVRAVKKEKTETKSPAISKPLVQNPNRRQRLNLRRKMTLSKISTVKKKTCSSTPKRKDVNMKTRYIN